MRVIAGRAEPPSGHEVLGVITTQCTALDGATGLMEAPCTEDSMAGLAREKAAERGGTALFSLVCGTDDSDRFVSRQQTGTGTQPGRTPSQTSTTTTIRTITTCRATVLRSEDARQPIAVASVSVAPGEQVVMSGQAVAIDWTPSSATDLRSRDPAEVGELEAFPAGYLRLGELTARCTAPCARSVVSRALKHAAAKRGALSLAESECSLDDERWSCHAAVVGPRLATSPRTAGQSTSGAAEQGSGGVAADGDAHTGAGGAQDEGVGGAAPRPD